MGKHPSRLTVIEHIETKTRRLFDWFGDGIPEGWRKVTHVGPIAEKYWDLPLYKGEFDAELAPKEGAEQ